LYLKCNHRKNDDERLKAVQNVALKKILWR